MNTFNKFKIFMFFVVMIFAASHIHAQVSTKPSGVTKVKKETFPQFSLAPTGGAIFPVTRDFRNDFKPGGIVGLDIAMKVNKEVGFYGKFNYMFMASKKSGAPIGQYMEFSAGPRYYFTHPKLKSQIYFEGGAGAYYFRQNAYVNPEDQTQTVALVSQTNAGINGGIGASLNISKVVDILAKGKYHNVFTKTGSVGFVTINAGLEFKFR